MSVPGLSKLDFVDSTVDDAGTAALRFKARRPLAYTAGQHMLWFVPGGGVKPFTIASAPADELVVLGTDLSSGSRFKRALGSLVSGAPARVLGPLGGFTADPADRHIVMLAQGLGVTPFRAILRQAVLDGSAADTTLVHVGVRHPFRTDTETAATHAHYPTSRESFTGRVEAAAAARPDATFMLSGSAAFVRTTAALLTGSAIQRSQIRRDKFYGYKHRDRPIPARSQQR